MNNIKNINYNHSEANFSKALGVSKARFDRLNDLVKSVLGNRVEPSKSEAIETVLKKAEPKNEAEMFLVGFMYGSRSFAHYSAMKDFQKVIKDKKEKAEKEGTSSYIQ